jgi:O-antigen ligase
VVLNLLALAAFVFAGHRKISRTLIHNKFVLLTLLFAASSALWSEDPPVTLRMSAELALSTCFACYLISRMSVANLMNLLMFVGTIAAIASTILALFFPRYGVFQGYAGGAWQGICIQKNTLGLSMAFLLTPVFFVRKPLLLKLAYSALILFLIGMSQSRGAWVETAGVLVFVAWLAVYRRFKAKQSFLFLLMSFALLVALSLCCLLNLPALAILLGKDPTLTGRTAIYSAVLNSILKRPILGYGFGAFWGFTQESASVGMAVGWSNIGYAENGLLELGLELGMVGVGLVALLFVRAFRQSIRLINSSQYNASVGWFSTLLVLEVLSNIESGWLMTANQIDWLLTLIAFLGLADEVRKLHQRPKRVAALDHRCAVSTAPTAGLRLPA